MLTRLKPPGLDVLANGAIDRDRPCLHDIEFTGQTILGPFHIHRTTVMVFDDYGKTSELPQFGIVETKALTFGHGSRHVFGKLVSVTP